MNHYGTSSSRERHDNARRQSSNTAIASFARAAEPGTGHQPQDGCEVAQACDGRGYENRADGAALNGADGSREGDGRCVPAPHAAAAGRLPLCPVQPSIPHLTRSALHRCLQRHGISRLPDVEGDKPKRQKFKRYPIGFFLIDIAEVQTAEGKLYLFVGIDRTSKFAVTQLVATADRKTAWEFLQHMLEAVPYQGHTILTDNGIQFADQPRNRNTITFRPMRFDMICEANGIEHRLTKPNHPWTNGQVERMNRTIKDATVKRFHYDSHDQLRTHLADFMAAYNFARRLKTLSGLTPYEYICKIWTSEPDRFILDPIHQMLGLNT